MSDTVLGHYRIIQKLGSGGMGDVHLAQDTRLDRQVALKMLPRYDQSDPAVVARFEREAKSAASLSHPHIVTIFELGQFDGRHYIAMEYVEGGTLAELADHGPLPEDQALGLALQIAEGLAAAHASNVVHRDIKPANILIDRTGRARICDFGLARLSSGATLTRTGAAMGTAAYMPPEQFQGGVVDHRADIWSLGAVLYEMITGQRPFAGDHDSAILYAVAHEECLPPSRRRSGLSPRWDSLISRCLAKSPSARFQSMTDVVAAMREIKDERQLPSFDSGHSKKVSTPSLAVLPFANMSTDVENEFFADGLTEDLITAFSKMKELRVVARTSAFQFKGKTSDVRHIGEQLNVGTVLEGSVRKSGNRLRVTAQLINVADGFHLWSERYDREMADVFEIQDDIAHAIVDALKVKLVGGTNSPLVLAGTSNMEAYHLVLQGRQHLNRRTFEAIKKAEACFLEAVRLDPDYADAYGALAVAYTVLHDHADQGKSDIDLKLEASAKRALRLNPEMPEAHAAMAMLKMERLDWTGAERDIRRAIVANPGYATAHQWYCLILSYQGRFEEARREIELAQSLDPLSLIIVVTVALPYYFERNYDRASRQLDRARKLDPDFGILLLYEGAIYSATGRLEEAVATYRRLHTINARVHLLPLLIRAALLTGDMDQMVDSLEKWCEATNAPFKKSIFREALAEGGKEELTTRIKGAIGEPWPEAQSSAAVMGALFGSLGDFDRAFAWLETGVNPLALFMRTLAVEPIFDPLRQDPRMPKLLKRLNLPVI